MASKTASRSSILTDGVKVNSLGFQVMSKVVLFRRPLQHSTVLKPEAPKFVLPVCLSESSDFNNGMTGWSSYLDSVSDCNVFHAVYKIDYVVSVNAPLHTLQKDYISKYTEKWPSAAILVIRAFTPWLVLPQCERASPNCNSYLKVEQKRSIL